MHNRLRRLLAGGFVLWVLSGVLVLGIIAFAAFDSGVWWRIGASAVLTILYTAGALHLTQKVNRWATRRPAA
jgi:1,4-dihydroxy-2-naphthoate octaprenyltransferase